MALATPLATQAMGLNASGGVPGGGGSAPKQTSSSMAGDRTTMPDASGGQGAGGWLVNAMKNLGKPAPTPTAGNRGIGGAILGGINTGINNAVTNIGNTAAPIQGVNQAANAKDYFTAMYGPQLAQLAQQANDVANQQRISSERYQGDKGYAQDQFANQQQQLQGDQYRNVDSKYNDLASLNNYLDAIYGSKTNQLSVNKDYLGAQGTLADVALRQQNANTGAQRTLADRGYGAAYGAINNARDMGIRDVYGNGASGAFGTAQGIAQQGLNTQRDQGLAQAQLSKDTTYQGLDYADQQAQLANTGTHLDLSHQSNDLQSQYDQYKAGYDKDKADAANQKSYLDSLAKDYGLQSDALKAQLQHTLAGMGLDYEQTMSQLASAANSANAQQAATAQAISQQIMANASQFSGVRPGSTSTAPKTTTPIRGKS